MHEKKSKEWNLIYDEEHVYAEKTKIVRQSFFILVDEN